MKPHLARRLGVLMVLAVLALPGAARADSVTQWSETAANALLRDAGQGAYGLPQMAMVHGAVFDATNAIDHRYRPYLTGLHARPWYSSDAAVAAAAHRVLVDGGMVRPDQQAALVAGIEPKYAAAIAAIPDGAAKRGGIATGEAAAWAMIAARTGDGRFGPMGFVLRPPGPGVWEPIPPTGNDPGAWLKDTEPFLLRHPERFGSPPPYPLTSRRYAADFNEVKALGRTDSTVRTPEQTTAARFWGGPTNAVATWSGMIRTLADLRPLSTVERARFYALVYLTTADAQITTWKSKDRWMFWRPLTAIRHADSDGNDATVADPAWTSLITNPPYPDHPSGLTTLGGAAVATLQELFGTDEVTFTGVNSLGATRRYARISDVVNETIDVRVWSGVHFRHADVAGAKVGRNVARWRRQHGFLRPQHHH
jgi:hypothetical protein